MSRLIAAVAENYRDEKGLMWPRVIVPFEVLVQRGEGMEDVYDILTSEDIVEGGAEIEFNLKSLDVVLFNWVFGGVGCSCGEINLGAAYTCAYSFFVHYMKFVNKKINHAPLNLNPQWALRQTKDNSLLNLCFKCHCLDMLSSQCPQILPLHSLH